MSTSLPVIVSRSCGPGTGWSPELPLAMGLTLELEAHRKTCRWKISVPYHPRVQVESSQVHSKYARPEYPRYRSGVSGWDIPDRQVFNGIEQLERSLSFGKKFDPHPLCTLSGTKGLRDCTENQQYHSTTGEASYDSRSFDVLMNILVDFWKHLQDRIVC